MNNFARTLRLAMRYRWNLAAAVGCSLIVAVLWGGNIGALYPVIEVVGNNQTLAQWADRSIAEADRNIAHFQKSIDELSGQLKQTSGEEDASIRRELSIAEMRLEAEQSARARYQAFKPYIEAYLPDSPFQTLVVIIAFLLLGTVIKDFFLALGTILVDRLAHLSTLDLRKQFFRRTIRMDLAGFDESGTSDLLSRFTYDLDSVATGTATVFGRAIREPLKMIACLAAAAYICWQLLLLSLIVAPLAGYLIAALARKLKRANRQAMEQMSSLYNILVESFQGIKVVKAFTMERHERRRFHITSKKCYKRAMRISILDALVSPVTELMGISTICVAILFGAYLVLNQQTHLFGIRISERPLSLSWLLVFYGMLAGVSDPARKLAEVFNRIQRAAAASDRIYQLFDREPQVADRAETVPLERHHRELHFDNVHFSYRTGQPVLEGIDLRIPFGETVAIVGPNGCGKSTLANLIPRFFDPSSGCLRLDGIDVRDVRLQDLRRQIGIVTQETLLFDDTVYNNIRYGAPHATRQQVIEAAKQAHAHKFIEQRLERGYDTLVGPQGGRLSGGQRQRIALARAILRDPAILILDEATSQIDLESEQLIHKVLEQFTRNRTTVIITHRLATLALADRIVVMQAGRIADIGTHDQLMARCELYGRLYQVQLRETA